jgi:hypothetical protein
MPQFKDAEELRNNPEFLGLSSASQDVIMEEYFPGTATPSLQMHEVQKPKPQALTELPRTAGLIDIGAPVDELPDVGSDFFSQVGGAVNEQFALGTQLMKDSFEGVTADGIMPYSPTALKGAAFGALGLLATVTSPLAPAFRMLENISRTSISGIEAAVGLEATRLGALNLTPESPTFLRAAGNVDALFKIAGRDRPTTGSSYGDFMADILSGIVPIERAVNISIRMAAAGSKAKSLEVLAERLPGVAATLRKSKQFQAIPDPQLFTREAKEFAKRFEAESVIGGAQRELPGLENAVIRGKDLSDEGIEWALDLTGGSYLRNAENAAALSARTDLAIAQGTPDSRSLLDLVPHTVYNVRNYFKQFRGSPADLTSAGKVLRTQGVSGNRLMDKIDRFFNSSESRAGDRIADLKNTLRGLTKKEMVDVRKMLDFGDAATSDKVRDAGFAIKEHLDDIAKQASELGELTRRDGVWIPFSPRESFFPHLIKQDEIIKDYEKIRAGLVNEKTNAIAADRALRDYLNIHTTQRQASLSHAREINLPEKYYETDLKGVLTDYFKSSERRLANIREFGVRDELAVGLFGDIAREGGNPNFAVHIIADITGNSASNSGTQKLASMLKASNIPLLAMSQMINLSQSASTALRTSTFATGKALVQTLFSPRKSAEFALRAGATLDTVTSEMARQLGGDKWGAKFLRMTGFNLTERINRTVAASAGKNYAENLAGKLLKGKGGKSVRRELERLGLAPDEIIAKGGLDFDDLRRAAQQVSNDSQFRSRITDLPLWWSSAEGKVVTQFKNFAFNQAKLIKNEMKQDPKRFAESVGKLVTVYPAFGFVFGEGRQQIREAVANNIFGRDIEFEDPDNQWVKDAFNTVGHRLTNSDANIIARVVDDATMAGAFGLFLDVANAAKYGDQGIQNLLFGPSVEYLFSGAQLVLNHNAKNALQTLERRSGLGAFIFGPGAGQTPLTFELLGVDDTPRTGGRRRRRRSRRRRR